MRYNPKQVEYGLKFLFNVCEITQFGVSLQEESQKYESFMSKSVKEQVSEYLSQFTVGIAGCGGLGSNAAMALARVGVGKLLLVDFDVITSESLDRQYFFYDQIGKLKIHGLRDNILKVNSGIIVKAFDLKLCTSDVVDLFSHCDVVIEAFDKAEMKQMIIETMLLNLPDIPLVVGVGLAGWGSNEEIMCRRSGNLIICGDEVSALSEFLPILAPRVAMVGNMQANEVVKILLKNFIPQSGIPS